MQKHTPGPWRAFASDDDVAGVETADGRVAIADCEVIGADMPPDDECGANARLIAAAPDLLDMLKKSADTLRDAAIAFRMFDKNMAASAMEFAEKHARAVIAAAEGV